jgi:hypothetical protein
VIIATNQIAAQAAGPPEGPEGPEGDGALSARLRDLSLVELDALTAGLASADAQVVVATFAEDVADALREARTRITALRQAMAGPDPLNVLELQARQRASDGGQAGAMRVHDRLVAQAQAARAFSRLADLASGLVGKLFEADRRR